VIWPASWSGLKPTR